MQGQTDPERQQSIQGGATGAQDRRGQGDPQDRHGQQGPRDPHGQQDRQGQGSSGTGTATQQDRQGDHNPVRNPSGDDISEAIDGDEGSGRGF